MTEKRPGYHFRRRSDGSVAHYWNPRRAVNSAPKVLPLRKLPDDATLEQIAALCRQYTDELLAELDDLKRGVEFDGTIESLVAVYRSDPESPYRRLKHTTRVRDYEPALRLIVDTVGKRVIRHCVGQDFRRWFREWGSKGRLRRAHGAIRKLRSALSYGATERLEGCAAAREILSLMTFEAPATRREKMEYEHARAICETAIAKGRPSIAFVQAMMWDTGLRRIHIIGEWLPVQEGDVGGITRGGTKWRGPTVADIGTGMVFTSPFVSKNKAATRHDLTKCPLVSWVLERITLPNFGPLVVSEVTSLPYRENYYAGDWREIADAAKVPREVWSMDARAGAISEAEAAMGLEAARKMAGHTDAKTTLGYVRNDDLENNRRVAEARAKMRK